MALPPDQYLTIVQAADLVVDSWHVSNTGPPGHRVGRDILYRLTDVTAWLQRVTQ